MFAFGMGRKRGFDYMDEIDVKLLKLLSEDSGQTATQIMSRVNLSIPAVNKRIAKLKSGGVIERFTIQVNPKQIEKPVLAFIMVVLNQNLQTDDFQRSSRKTRTLWSAMPLPASTITY